MSSIEIEEQATKAAPEPAQLHDYLGLMRESSKLNTNLPGSSFEKTLPVFLTCDDSRLPEENAEDDDTFCDEMDLDDCSFWGRLKFLLQFMWGAYWGRY